ncbi:MAG: M48 family metalloprotease [Erythrobacter sp.]
MALDPAAATQAYIDTLSADELALARDYTTGNHWLILGGLLVSALVTWLIVRSGALDWVFNKISDKWQNLRVFVVAAVFNLVSTFLTLPYSIYTEWSRESVYGRTSQPLTDYLSQGAIGTVISTLLGSLLLVGVYFLIRRSAKLWWAWAGGLVAVFAAMAMLLSPTLIEPLFNDFQPIPDGEVQDAVYAMADEADIPRDRVFMFDGSRQSNNFTANVSGIGSSARIAISDVAMDEATLDEVKAVTGHEVGHYVLGHVWRMIGVISFMAIIGFFLTAKTYDWFARKFGTDAAISDVRGIAVLTFTVGLFMALLQPALNNIIRIGEEEADDYSLATVGLPDGLSGALIKTAEYRYPLAGPLEETLLYTHPTVENRVRNAMEWKAANAPSK